jgi:hypothetical protein
MLMEALVVAATTLGGDELKCRRTHQLPGLSASSNVVFVDGEFYREQDELTARVSSRDDLFRIELSCWNPDTDEFNSRLGGIPLVLVVSVEAQAEAAARSQDMAQRVRAHVESTGGLPPSLRDLGADASRFSLSVLESGWSIAPIDDSHLHCSLTQPDDGTESTVDCSVNYDRIRSELRAVYERGLGLSN